MQGIVVCMYGWYIIGKNSRDVIPTLLSMDSIPTCCFFFFSNVFTATYAHKRGVMTRKTHTPYVCAKQTAEMKLLERNVRAVGTYSER